MKKKIKLLLVSSVFGDRGAERLILLIYNFLPRSMYEIKILCLRDLAPFADYLNRNTHIPVDIIGMKNNFDFAAIVRLYKRIKEFGPDIINFHHYRAALWGRPLAKVSNVPVILYSVHNKWGGPFHHFLDRMVAKFTDAIVPFSNSVKEYLVNIEKIPEKLIEKPIYAGIDIDKFHTINENEVASLRTELGLIENQNVIGYVGNITLEKGLLYLIESVRKLHNKFTDICCLIIGEGPDEDLLKEKIAHYQLSGYFKFLGPRHDIPNLLKVMKIFVLPSLREGLPVVVIEAISASCPVIATNVDGIPEIIRHEKNGLLVPPANVKELSHAIERLLSSTELREEFAREGYKTAIENFSIKKMVESYDNLYQRYLNKSS